MNSIVEKQVTSLNGKTKDELNVIARHLKIPNFRKLSKETLIQRILQSGYEEKDFLPHTSSWWQRNHNHVYGVVGILLTIIGIIVAVLFYRWQTNVTNSPLTQAVAPSNSFKGDSNIDSIDARIASESKSFSPISLDEYYSKRYSDSSTDLSTDQMEKDLVGKTVIWIGKIKWIKPGKNDGVEVLVTTSDNESKSAFLEFDSSQKNDFLPLHNGQTIKVTCVVKDFIVSPFLNNCTLIQVIQ